MTNKYLWHTGDFIVEQESADTETTATTEQQAGDDNEANQ